MTEKETRPKNIRIEEGHTAHKGNALPSSNLGIDPVFQTRRHLVVSRV